MSFRKKADTILTYKPDILIVPECEHPGKLIFNNSHRKPQSVLWFGHNQNKGLGVFSFSNFRFEVLNTHNENSKTIAPLAVSNGRSSFNLFAIWANNPKDPDGNYITQVWKAIHHYDSLLKNKQTILIGDFNSNTIWDRPRREGNHSAVVGHLEKKGIHSLYHKYFRQAQGKEKHCTLYMYRHKDKGYHIDYCFASEDFAERLKSVEIGEYNSWRKYSDHVPVIVIFKRARYLRPDG
jgi:exonuclease III